MTDYNFSAQPFDDDSSPAAQLNAAELAVLLDPTPYRIWWRDYLRSAAAVSEADVRDAALREIALDVIRGK